MSDNGYAQFEQKSSGDRTVMHVLYGLHTLAPFTLLSLSVIALIVNYIKRPDEHDPLYATHHNYMISTFWWAILWFVLTGPLWIFFLFPGAVAWTVIGLWYLYRYIRGWLRFNNHQTPQ